MEEDKLNSFNLPIYGASTDEVKAAVKQTGLFDINEIKLFESNWDPYVTTQKMTMCKIASRVG
jgi:hypothetical protein